MPHTKLTSRRLTETAHLRSKCPRLCVLGDSPGTPQRQMGVNNVSLETRLSHASSLCDSIGNEASVTLRHSRRSSWWWRKIGAALVDCLIKPLCVIPPPPSIKFLRSPHTPQVHESGNNASRRVTPMTLKRRCVRHILNRTYHLPPPRIQITEFGPKPSFWQ